MKTMMNMIKKPAEVKAETAPAPIKAVMQNSTQNNSAAQNSQKEFQILTARIQSFLNSGAQALEIAETKTEQVAKMDPASADYAKMVEEVKAFQARAGYDFKQAEALLATANSLLPKKPNN